jgi:CubicO group peptidase (beta-lactamase class C family)
MKEKKVNLHSFLIARGGKILTEAYYKPFDKDFQHRLYSCSKTYVALAVGLLIGEGKIRLDDKIMDLLPEYANENQHKWLKECTVEDALKMSVPQLSDTYIARDYKEWAWTFFNHPTKAKALKPASTVFNYNTSGSFILDVIVEKITGKRFLEYMRPVFDKIGVAKDIWCVKAPDGYSWGGSGVITTLRDFAKVAELLLHKGEYNGEQLLPRDYMEKMTSKQISNIQGNAYSTFETQGYGYQTWITNYGFAMNGMGSQFAFCFPEKDMIFVCQGDTQGAPVGDFIYEQFVHEVYEKAQDAPLATGKAYEKLQNEVKNLALYVDYGVAHTPFEKEIDGAKYELEENPMGWKWFRFDFKGETGVLTYENERGVKKIAFGCNALEKGTFPETHYYGDQVDTPANRELNCLADCSWTEEKKVLLRVYIVDYSFGNCFMTFGFKGDEVGVMMHKTAEFFMNEYTGFAGGYKA